MYILFHKYFTSDIIFLIWLQIIRVQFINKLRLKHDLIKVKQFTLCSHGNSLLFAQTPKQEMLMIYNVGSTVDVFDLICDEKFTLFCVFHYNGDDEVWTYLRSRVFP